MEHATRHVLVVEDDPFQAMDIGRFVRETGGEVLGPAASLERAMPLVAAADAAVLDLALAHRHDFVLANALAARGVHFVFLAGPRDEADLPARFSDVPVIRAQAEGPAGGLAFLRQCAAIEPEAALPWLRLAARLAYPDPAAADRMVERLLREAIHDASTGHPLHSSADRAQWLMERMRDLLRDHRRDFMN